MDFISWQAPEYYHEHKTADWYWAVSIIATSGAAVAVVFNNVLLALLIVIGAISLMLVSSRPPKIVDVKIDSNGIVLGKFRYPYGTLRSFWIHEYDHHAKLLLTSTKTLAPLVVISIDPADINPQDVRELLQPHIAEEEQHEPLLQLIMEYLGF